MPNLLIDDEAWAIITIVQEARGEIYEGKVAVGEVIRNRMRRRYSSDGTVAGTVLLPYQFSGWNTGDPNRITCAKLTTDDPMVIECAKAWRESETSTLVKDAVLYYNPLGVSKTPKWVPKSIFICTVGHHNFYTERRRR